MTSTKKKLGVVIGGVVVVGAAVALTAGTFSYFSDSHSTSAGSVSDGTLTLGLSVAKVGSTNAINDTNVEPGWSDTETITVTNTGSVPGELRLGLRDSGNSNLANDMTISAPGYGSSSVSTAVGGTSGGLEVGVLNAGQTESYAVTLALPTTAGNNVQGAVLDLVIVGDLQQTDNGATTGGTFPAPGA
ncbi:MAG TPA: TasA family protein [Pseudonocardiaceae bacterium]|jgi:hypothetical protein|nr:TasA family protein [Pseudonocardiaceae bacterium]